MNSQTGSTLEIPLKKLVAWNGNVRRTTTDQGIRSLLPLLQPMGYFRIWSSRKPRAASRLHRQRRSSYRDRPYRERRTRGYARRGAIPSIPQIDQRRPICCRYRGAVRCRRGCCQSPSRAGRISPLLLQKYREGEMNLQLLQAFTLTDDHAAQEPVWHQLQPWNRKPQTHPLNALSRRYTRR